MNLNNMGSIGGRMEEQDYLEVGSIFQISPFKNAGSTIINVQLRHLYSPYLQLADPKSWGFTQE
ncbi:MAG: hypothetical protein KTR26_06990 [Flammeovirgaceae bacterium]|nr:hypothetical protein [Flammeovirgaceae bacterium]